MSEQRKHSFTWCNFCDHCGTYAVGAPPECERRSGEEMRRFALMLVVCFCAMIAAETCLGFHPDPYVSDRRQGDG